jgi:soluble lytic murein transglycosylase
LFDPATNIAIGAAEYAQKLAARDGNHVLAIASYNAGDEAVSDWATRTSPADLDRFVESIPFAETRLYVKTVTRNRHEYRRIYQSK